MAESTLSRTRAQMSREIAFYLFGLRKADTGEGLSSTQNANVVAAREAGEARFACAHDWGFLRPWLDFTLWSSVAVSASLTATGVYGTVTTITANTATFYASMVGKTIVVTGEGSFTIATYVSSTVITVTGDQSWSGSKTFSIEADGTYLLPDDFGGLESTYIHFGRNSNRSEKINVVSVDFVTSAWQLNLSTARPRTAATRMQANDGTGQRWELICEPIPDTNYATTFQYNTLPDAMGSTDYGAGGMAYSDALLKCCLAAAEEKYRSNETVMEKQEAKALSKAVRWDLRYNRPRKLGRTTQSNFKDMDDNLDSSRATGFVYRGETLSVE